MPLPSIIFYLIIAIFNLCLAAFILITLLPSYLLRFSIGPLPSTFLEMMFFCLIIVWLIKKIRNRNLIDSLRKVKNLFGRSLLFIIGLFILSATIAIFISPNTRAALGIWKAYFVEPIILFFIFLDIFSKRDISKIILSLAISALIISGLAVLQKFTGWFVPYTFWGKDNTFRVTSFYGYPNAIGLYLAPIIPLIFFQIKYFLNTHLFVIPAQAGIQANKKQSILLTFFYLLIVICVPLSIIWSQSTGALIALILGLIITGLFFKRTKFWSVLFFIIILTLIFSNVLPTNITDTLFLKDWSGQVRVKMWTETWQMLKHNFIFGAGLSGYKTLVAPYHIWPFVEIFQYPHNIIFNFWSETGLLGLISFLTLIFIFFKKIISEFKTSQNKFLFFCLAWSMLIILIHGLVDVPYFKNDLAILFWLIFSFLFLIDKDEKCSKITISRQMSDRADVKSVRKVQTPHKKIVLQ